VPLTCSGQRCLNQANRKTGCHLAPAAGIMDLSTCALTRDVQAVETLSLQGKALAPTVLAEASSLSRRKAWSWLAWWC
jgi:hypothetical protein